MGCHFLFHGSSQPRIRTQVSCIIGRFFTSEPPGKPYGGQQRVGGGHSSGHWVGDVSFFCEINLIREISFNEGIFDNHPDREKFIQLCLIH